MSTDNPRMAADYPRATLDLAAYHARVRAACFVCEVVAGNPAYPNPEVYRDEEAIVFLSAYPWLLGHLLVAPVRHREHVVADLDLPEYLRLQAMLHAAGRAVSAEVPTERLYVLSLGSQQGNRHVHWHVVPLPPGVPYDRQQVAAMTTEAGYLLMPPADQAALAARIGTRLRRLLAT